MQIDSFSEFLLDFVNTINAFLEDGEGDLYFTDDQTDLLDNAVSPTHALYIEGVAQLLGEILAKNLVDRKIILELTFKLIDIEQGDKVLKKLGRDAIDIALNYAENDQSVDFFKYMPCFVIPILKNSSTNKLFSELMGKLFKLLPLNKAGVFDQDSTMDGFDFTEEYQKGFEFLKILSNKKSENKEAILNSLHSKAVIREYQEHGIAWVVSLTDFGFNCALCDDMGLGKTFQALAAVSIKVNERKRLYGKEKGKSISLVV